jgi:hypothetical protein
MVANAGAVAQDLHEKIRLQVASSKSDRNKSHIYLA